MDFEFRLDEVLDVESLPDEDEWHHTFIVVSDDENSDGPWVFGPFRSREDAFKNALIRAKRIHISGNYPECKLVADEDDGRVMLVHENGDELIWWYVSTMSDDGVE